MNLIIVDYDCIRRFKNEQEASKIFNDSKVFFINSEALAEKHYRLIDVAGGADIARCVIITSFDGGVRRYHHQLVKSNPQIKNWLFSVIGMEFDAYRKQVINEIDSKLSDMKIRYSVIFDESDGFEQTKQYCAAAVREKNLFLAVSRNGALAEKVVKSFSSLLPDWELRTAAGDDGYSEADAILAVGETEEDFAVPAPEYGMGRYRAWLNISEPGKSREDISDKILSAADALMDNGWNIGSAANVMCSNIKYEDFNLALKDGSTSPSMLKSDDGFIIWDDYGLPLNSDAYTEDNITGFLEHICCFGEIADMFE